MDIFCLNKYKRTGCGIAAQIHGKTAFCYQSSLHYIWLPGYCQSWSYGNSRWGCFELLQASFRLFYHDFDIDPMSMLERTLKHNLGPSVEIRYIRIPNENPNQGVANLEPAASNCPPDSCIGFFKSLHGKIKTERADALSVFMVRVSRFELEASWTPFKRDTKLRHTRIFTFCLLASESAYL